MVRIVKEPDIRRNELIACASRLFYTKGYESTSVNDIVQEAGVAKGTFYHYFDSKVMLLEALVEQYIAASLKLLEEAVADDSLDAVSKIKCIYRLVGNWKTARKDELLPLIQAFYGDENILLLHKLKLQSVTAVTPTLIRVIEQGVAEGLFQTDHVPDTAEIFYHTTQAFSETFALILLNADTYTEPAMVVKQKKVAYEQAIERILGAPTGSLPLFDEAIIDAWFA